MQRDLPERLRRRLRVRRPVGATLTRLLLPFTCNHGVKCRARGRNVYLPCGRGCGVFEPERWWHRLGWRLSQGRYDPFGRSAKGLKPW